MTLPQDKLYWREWAAARRLDPFLDRHECHVKALGVDKSHASFSNDEFDRVLAFFRSISRPADVNAQIRQLEQPKIRLLHKIQVEQLAVLGGLLSDGTDEEKQSLADHYVRSILKDRFSGLAIENLTFSDLKMLRATLAARISRLRKVCQTAAI